MSRCRLTFFVLIILSLSFLGCSSGGDGDSSAGSSGPAAVQALYNISGIVSGEVTGGVTVTLSGDGSATTITAADGTYTFEGVADGNYTVTPTLTGNRFTPASLAATVNGADQAGLDFVSSPGEWTWVSGPAIGSDTTARKGTYGTLGIADANNLPSARYFPTSCKDKAGNFWLFGGYGYDSVGGYGRLGDLWKFDGAKWTWVSGSDRAGVAGSYGTKGVPSATNVPSARSAAVSWVDNNGNFWLFGGYGKDSKGVTGEFNDLWKFDGNSWTWMSGSEFANTVGTYGTKGVPHPTNTPGARDEAVSWVDNSGNLWLFGGYGYDSVGLGLYLNDLWKFDGNNWTWMGGPLTGDKEGSYGTIGVPASTNYPGARYGATACTDKSGKVWLFGGWGFVSSYSVGRLNDLWKFDGSTWTWVGGSSERNKSGSYGTIGVPASTNYPGGRDYATAWADESGNFWLFGGYGYAAAGNYSRLNDLWKFDGSNWTWIRGSSDVNQAGIYGTKGVSAATNSPGARYGTASYIDNSGTLWLFGGEGYDSTGRVYYLNDLWRY